MIHGRFAMARYRPGFHHRSRRLHRAAQRQSAVSSAVRDGDLRQLRVHDLRHSCATLLFTMGVQPATVQRILRHSSITVTTGTYVEVIEAVQRDALDSMGSLFTHAGDGPTVRHCRQGACRCRQNCRQTPQTRSLKISLFLVELRGLEPLTPTLPVWCATSCAIAPRSCAHRSYTTGKSGSKSLVRASSEVDATGGHTGRFFNALSHALSNSRIGCGQPTETGVADVAQ